MSDVVLCLPGFALELDPEDDTVSDWIRRNLWWERTAASFLVPFVRPGDVVVDAGAHLGYYTCLLAHLVGPAGWVYAFEPARRMHEILVRNVARNDLQNVSCVPQALGDQDGPVFFHTAQRGNTGDSYVIPKGPDTVPMTRLDTFLAGQPPERRRVAILKSDTQGCEWRVLQGMGAYRQDLSAALIEWSPGSLQGATGVDLLRLLRESFTLLWTNDDHPPIALDSDPPLGQGDLLCVRRHP